MKPLLEEERKERELPGDTDRRQLAQISNGVCASEMECLLSAEDMMYLHRGGNGC